MSRRGRKRRSRAGKAANHGKRPNAGELLRPGSIDPGLMHLRGIFS